MGRKKKKQQKPWCWYCNREFDDEKILIQHQKAKHFKCHICHKKLYTGPGLSIHCMQVHKETMDKVPNALANRNNIEIEIYGMEGIPEDDVRQPNTAPAPLDEDDDEPAPSSSRAKPVQPPPKPFGLIDNPPLPPAGAMAPGPPMMAPHMAPMPGFMPAAGHMGPMRPMGPRMGPIPPGMAPMPGMMHGGPIPVRPGIPRPLFPAAQASVNAAAPHAPSHHDPSRVGPRFQQSNPSEPPSAPTPQQLVRKPELVIQPSSGPGGGASLIVHPDQDLSLEELRCKQSAYSGTRNLDNGRSQPDSYSANRPNHAMYDRSGPPGRGPVPGAGMSHARGAPGMMSRGYGTGMPGASLLGDRPH